MAKTDKKTMELINQVIQQRAEIAHLDKPSYKTNCSFCFIEGNKSNAINIHVETDIRRLLSIVGFLMDKESSYGRAIHLLSSGNLSSPAINTLKVPAFSWDGYTVSEWTHDLKARINKVQITDKKASLEAFESRLRKIVSPELQAELELEAISAELGK